MKKGLLVFVYRNTLGDCTADGVTSKLDKMVLLDVPNTPFEPKDDQSDALVLVKRELFGKEYIHAEPVHKKPGMVGPMFGGNFIYSSDSRFPSKYPIPVHDRFETQAHYDSHFD